MRCGSSIRGVAPAWEMSTGKRAARAADDRRIAQELRHRLGVERRGHHDDHQVLAHGLPHLAEQRDRQVGVQAALVELVEHDAADAFEERVVEQLPREHALGHDAQACRGGDLALEADVVADLAAELSSRSPRRSALRRGPGGDAARLEQHEIRMLGRQQLCLHDRRRHARRLARARLGDEHERSRRRAQLREHFGNDGIDRKGRHHRAFAVANRFACDDSANTR